MYKFLFNDIYLILNKKENKDTFKELINLIIEPVFNCLIKELYPYIFLIIFLFLLFIFLNLGIIILIIRNKS